MPQKFKPILSEGLIGRGSLLIGLRPGAVLPGQLHRRLGWRQVGAAVAEARMLAAVTQ
jgi:hypothetical protein